MYATVVVNKQPQKRTTMQIIRRAFNPEGGNARAACVDIGNYAVGLIINGNDADAIVAQFEALEY